MLTFYFGYRFYEFLQELDKLNILNLFNKKIKLDFIYFVFNNEIYFREFQKLLLKNNYLFNIVNNKCKIELSQYGSNIIEINNKILRNIYAPNANFYIKNKINNKIGSFVCNEVIIQSHKNIPENLTCNILLINEEVKLNKLDLNKLLNTKHILIRKNFNENINNFNFLKQNNTFIQNNLMKQFSGNSCFNLIYTQKLNLFKNFNRIYEEYICFTNKLYFKT